MGMTKKTRGRGKAKEYPLTPQAQQALKRYNRQVSRGSTKEECEFIEAPLVLMNDGLNGRQASVALQKDPSEVYKRVTRAPFVAASAALHMRPDEYFWFLHAMFGVDTVMKKGDRKYQKMMLEIAGERQDQEDE